MKLSDVELHKHIIEVASSEFGDNAFARRSLMEKVEQSLRARGAWSEEDDLASGSVGRKSKGMERIDYAFIPLERIYRCLSHEGRDLWRVSGGLDNIKLNVGIILKVSFGATSEIYPDTYLEELHVRAVSGKPWNLPSMPKVLEGGGKKVLLYDKVRKGITAEFVVARIVKTDLEEMYPWSCYLKSNSVRVFEPLLDAQMIGSIEGLKTLVTGRPPYRNVSGAQYDQLTNYQNNNQATDHVIDGMLKHGPDYYRFRNNEMMSRRKLKDNYTCQACGFFLKVGNSYIIECHHKIPISQGERITSLDDLISLCPNCHRVAHANNEGLLNLEQIREIITMA
jgi:hypothetical protein